MWAEGSQDIGFIVDSLHECQPFDRPQRNEHFHGLNHQEQSSRSWNKHTKEAGTLLCAFGRASELFDFSDSKKFKSFFLVFRNFVDVLDCIAIFFVTIENCFRGPCVS